MTIFDASSGIDVRFSTPGAETEVYALALDLSTTCTGWSCFSKTGKLLFYGTIKKSKIKSKIKLLATLENMIDMAQRIKVLISVCAPTHLIVEEITGSRNRLTQKVLDGFHFILLYNIRDWIGNITYYDVTGAHGWRTHLGLRLSDADKSHNKEARKLNKHLPRAQKISVIGPKHLACRYANQRFQLELNCDVSVYDGDIADSISMGDSFFKNLSKLPII